MPLTRWPPGAHPGRRYCPAMFGGASASSPARAAAASASPSAACPAQLLILVPTQIIEVRGQKNKKGAGRRVEQTS